MTDLEVSIPLVNDQPSYSSVSVSNFLEYTKLIGGDNEGGADSTKVSSIARYIHYKRYLLPLSVSKMKHM